MTGQDVRETEHRITVKAPAQIVYRLLAEVPDWPLIFPPTVYAHRIEGTDREERIQIWATANGEAKTWVSRRELDPQRMRIRFRQEVSQPPVAAMGGTWFVEERAPGGCRVRLLHDYQAVDDDPERLRWIDDAVERNSHAELTALKHTAELAGASADLRLSFEDTVLVNGEGKDAFDFINEAGLWSQRLPHVSRVDLREEVPGLQWLTMDTVARDGSTHTTRSVRVSFPHERIVYKQVQVPALMTLHTGEWLFEERTGGVAVTSRHTVAINEANIVPVLGAGCGVEDAKAYVHAALSANSLATLGHARAYAESRRGVGG